MCDFRSSQTKVPPECLMGKETQSRMRANHFRKKEDIYLNVLIDLPGCDGDPTFNCTYTKASGHQLMVEVERGWSLVGNRKELGMLGKGPESVMTGEYDVSSLQACMRTSQPNPLLCIIDISYQKHF